MNKFIASTAIALVFSTAAFAGDPTSGAKDDVIVDPFVPAADTGKSSDNAGLLILAGLAVAAALAGGGDDDSDDSSTTTSATAE